MKARCRGFTLLEMLLASVLLGSLLLALNLFVFAMAEIWGRGAERRLFEQHARAVTREVETWFRTAVLPPAAEPAVFIAEIQRQDGRRESPLTLVLPGGLDRLPWRETALPEVVGSLVVEPERGLVLYWQSRLETAFDAGAPRAWLVTPFVTALGYDYQDNGIWRSVEQLERGPDGNWRVPARLRLQFRHGELRLETSLAVPDAEIPLLHF